MTVRAIWHDTIVAESTETIVVEGNHYFPPSDVMKIYLFPSNTHSICPWKGQASYYDVTVDGDSNADAAWYYPEPSEAARAIAGYIAFWKGVNVVVDT